jgi:hypothetical protein
VTKKYRKALKSTKIGFGLVKVREEALLGLELA